MDPANNGDTTRQDNSKYIRRKPVPLRAQPTNLDQDRIKSWDPLPEKETVISIIPMSVSNSFTSSQSPCPWLPRPIVIPCSLKFTGGVVVGLPFPRVWPGYIESDYGISKRDFLNFIDEFNISRRGHVGISYVGTVGSVVHTVGNFDPTKITQLVGASIKLSADLARVASMNGPLARMKKSFLDTANDEIFNPKRLRVRIINTKELRKIVGIGPDSTFVAPLMQHWTVPSSEEMRKGQRSRLRVGHRLVGHLVSQKLVSDFFYAGELSQASTEGSMKKKAIQEVNRLMVSAEILFEEHRSKALKKYNMSLDEGLTMKQREKLKKAAESADKEVSSAEKCDWLLIENLDSDTTTT